MHGHALPTSQSPSMKVLIYGINFAPELTGVGKYSGEMATWLAAKGHEVRVITAPPYYPNWSIGVGYSSRRWRRENVEGVGVWRCPLWIPSTVTGLKRLLHLASFALSSLPAMLLQLRWRPDIIWIVEPALFCAPTAAAIARLSGGKAWLHVQDYEVDAAFELGLLRGAFLRRLVLAGERWLMQRFDRVSTISGRMLQLALAKGVESERLRFFPNWVDIASVQPMSSSSYRAELGIPANAIVALYSGNMGRKQGLEVLADTALHLQDERDLAFVFCGDGPGKEDLIQRCGGLPNVRFLDLQPVERLSDLLALADVHLLPQKADAADLVMPSKLTGMLASGRPVVATAAQTTELGQVVQERAQCGVLVPPDNFKAIAKAVLELAKDPERRARLGASGRAYAEREVDREVVLCRFERDLLECVGER